MQRAWLWPLTQCCELISLLCAVKRQQWSQFEQQVHSELAELLSEAGNMHVHLANALRVEADHLTAALTPGGALPAALHAPCCTRSCTGVSRAWLAGAQANGHQACKAGPDCCLAASAMSLLLASTLQDCQAPRQGWDM